MSKLTQPKNLRKMISRSAILALVVACLIYGYQFYGQWSRDIDMPAENHTVGFIASTQMLDDGSKVVLFKPDGTMVESPEYKAGYSDKDPVWRPDGNRLFFISDRVENAQNIFRWNIDAAHLSRKTYNSRSKGNLSFLPNSSPNANKKALVISGGFVLEFNPVTATTQQVLPPVAKDRVATDDQSGAAGQFDTAYQKLGMSFKEARWTPDEKFVVAIMRREIGETLMLQELNSTNPPIPLVAGDKVEFDIDPVTGKILFLVLNFRLFDEQNPPSEYIKGGKLVLPFRHMIAMVDPAKMSSPQTANEATTVMIQSKSDDNAFHRLSISPDGSMFMIVDGRLDMTRGQVEPRTLVVMPFTENAASAPTPIVQDKIYEPAWSPDSNKIVFIKYNEKDQRAIWTINRDGSEMKSVSKDLGDFSFPRFSPQK